MADESPTDNGVDQNSGGVSTPLPDQSTNQSADEQNQGTDSGGEQSHVSDQGSQNEPDKNQTTQTDDGSDDEALAKFAKSQGIEDLSDLSDREKRLLKVARDNQVTARTKSQKENEGKLNEEVENLHQPAPSDEDDDVTALLRRQDAELRQIKARQRSQDFFLQNPQAKELEAEMVQVIKNEREKYGDAAAAHLASNLDRVFREAKELQGGNDTDSAREAGRREERESLRKRQEASAGGASASDHSGGGKTKVTREWISTTYDAKNPEHVKMLDEAMASGNIS